MAWYGYICNKVANFTLVQLPTIRQFIAGVLLLVFSFSIAPKKFLHDAFAHHKDKTAVATKWGGTQLSNTGFMCKCDNLVAESPFTDEVQQFVFVQPHFFSVQPSTGLYHFYSSPVFFFELRGPPASGAAML